MIYVITDPTKTQLFMTASDENFHVDVMGQSRLLVIPNKDLAYVYKVVKEKTGVSLDSSTSSLVFLSDKDDVSELSIDQMAQLSTAGEHQVYEGDVKTYPFSDLSNDAFNILAALASVDTPGVIIDYEKKQVSIDPTAGLQIENVLTKQKSVVTEDVIDDDGKKVGERVTQKESYVPITVPIDDVISDVESREELDPNANVVVSVDTESKSDWYKKIIAGAAGVTTLLVITLLLSGIVQDFAASKVRRGSTNRIFIKLAGVGSLRHRKSGYGKDFNDNAKSLLGDIDALFYHVSVIRSVNIVGTGTTSGAIAHYEPITDFGFEHGLFMIHTPTTSFVVTTFDKTNMYLGLYDTSSDSDEISDGLYSGYLKPDVNNIFQ